MLLFGDLVVFTRQGAASSLPSGCSLATPWLHRLGCCASSSCCSLGDVLEFRAALQPLVDGILVKMTQRAALRKQLGWPGRCHSMLWSERDAFGVPSWIQDSQLHCEAVDGDLVKSHYAMLSLAALCLEVKAAGPACSEGSPRKRVASAGGQIFLHAAPIQEQTVLGLYGNYGNRTRGPLKTHRAKMCSYGRRTLGPYKSHRATRNYGKRSQGPLKSLWAQKCEGRRAREPVTGPSGGPLVSLPPLPAHAMDGTAARTTTMARTRHGAALCK